MAGIGINSDLYLAREALQVATLQTATAGSNLLVTAGEEGFEYALAEGLLADDRYFHVISRC